MSVTDLAPVPMVAELALYWSADIFSVWQQAEDRGAPGQPPPFWAVPWPGGQALARYVLDHRDLVAGRRVLDIGSGSGLVAIAAQLAGADTVLASETDPLAAAAIRLNAQANGVPAPQIVADVLDGDGESAQLVLAADVWYAAPLADRVLGLFARSRARGAQVLTGDLGRAFLPRRLFRSVASFDIPVVAGLEDSAVKHTTIWAPA